MKRTAVLVALSAAFIVLAIAGTATANNNSSQCGTGKLVVNVTYGLYNDFDSGVGGNAWANDTITRHLQVRVVGDGTYCAVVNDTGSFVTFDGTSPSGHGTVTAGIAGEINGGYTSTVFSGTLDPSPAYATRGNLGSFNLECTDASNCPGADPSFLSYFSSVTGADLADWGWSYHTAQNGDWLNALSGNAGDITG